MDNKTKPSETHKTKTFKKYFTNEIPIEIFIFTIISNNNDPKDTN